ncbi:MAG: hypothetical protein QME66_05820 [Candidatus Eisenbacteria bacterium]|nr:hypothetical protein [Candidatus Eisenbacteria bacterium]
MAFFDDLAKGALGGATGFFTGGLPGLVAGGLTGGLRRGPLTLRSGLETGLMGAGAGGLAKGIGGFIPRISTGAGAGATAGGGFRDLLGRAGGAFSRGIKAIPGLLGGLGGLGQLGGIFRGGGQQPGVQQPMQGAPPLGGAQGGLPAGGQFDLARALSLLGGGAATGFALSQGGPDVDLAGLFEGSTQASQQAFENQLAREAQARHAIEQQFLANQASTRGRLEELLGGGTEQALRGILDPRIAQLQRQGLLGGPSGALNEALAQSAAQVRAQQLPALLGFEQESGRGLDLLRQGGLEGALALQRGGLQRQFQLEDLTRGASLRERLLQSESEAAKRQALARAGGQLVGFGLGGAPGAQAGRQVFEDIFGGGGSGGARVLPV